MSSEVARLIDSAATGDIDAYMKLYRAVYKPLYKIAVIAVINKQTAADTVVKTACDGFLSLSRPGINKSSGFMEWIIKLLCENIKKSELANAACENDTEAALSQLSAMERLVFAVSTVCGCNAEKTAKLCGYTVDTVSVCLANTEVKLKAALALN